MILIFSHKDDVHVKAVVSHISEEDYIVIDSGNFPDQLYISLSIEDDVFTPVLVDKYNNIKINAKDIKTVWYRKPSGIRAKTFMKNMGDFIKRESEDTLYGFLWGLESRGCKLYNHPFQNYYASIKPYQLLQAQSAGLSIPDTLISNDPEIANDFLTGSTDCILKGVSLSFARDEDNHYPIFVKKIDNEFKSRINELNQCPVTMQNFVDKVSDIRVFVIDNKILAFAIHPSSSRSVVDWRTGLDDDNELEYEPHYLPDNVNKKIQDFFSKMNLRSGSLDFSLNKNGEYYFLEVNPNGQWLWLEHKTGVSISKEIANSLMGIF